LTPPRGVLGRGDDWFVAALQFVMVVKFVKFVKFEEELEFISK